MKMGDSFNNNTQSIADYLGQLLKDKKQLAAFPNVFIHVERLLDDEIGKVRGNLFQINGKKSEPLQLPDADGPQVSLSEKVYVPIKDHPDFNFVGRILGPRGMTTKQLEQETGCKIMVRGKGSMRDRKKEEQNRGKLNWEHLNDELHVLITVEDTENRANLKMQRAIDEVKKLLIVSEGEDELKKRQLMELAIINGTYRDSVVKVHSPLDLVALDSTHRLLAANNHAAIQNIVNQQNALRSGPLGGAPLILSPRIQVPTSLANTVSLMNGGGGPPPLIAPSDSQVSSLLYAQYAAAEYPNYTGLVSPLLAAEYTTDPTGSAVGGGKDRRNPIVQSTRPHPYPPRS